MRDKPVASAQLRDSNTQDKRRDGGGEEAQADIGATLELHLIGIVNCGGCGRKRSLQMHPAIIKMAT